MGTCEPGQGRNPAAISSQPFVRWVSHRRPSESDTEGGHRAMTNRSHAEPVTEMSAPEKKQGVYVVVARRYRPQTFADLVGQQHVAKALTGAIAANRVGHAYLF